MIIDELYMTSKEISPICLGLDTAIKYLPDYLLNSQGNIQDKILEFNKAIIDSTHDIVACYKVQIAYYEALGIKGLEVYSKTLKYIKEIGKISIGDIKRGDIAATGDMYAQAHFQGDFEADMITVNGYMGEDAISPYYEYLKEKGKGLFILLRTSNASAGEVQNISTKEGFLYDNMATLIDRWGSSFIGQHGYSSIGAVVGLTVPRELELIQEKIPRTFFLVPGYGAQGGKGEDIAAIINKRHCAIVNSSRGLISAHKGINEGKTYVDEIRNATLKMKEDLIFG